MDKELTPFQKGLVHFADMIDDNSSCPYPVPVSNIVTGDIYKQLLVLAKAEKTEERNLKSSEQILGFIEGMIMEKLNEGLNEKDPKVSLLQDIVAYITINI